MVLRFFPDSFSYRVLNYSKYKGLYRGDNLQNFFSHAVLGVLAPCSFGGRFSVPLWVSSGAWSARWSLQSASLGVVARRLSGCRPGSFISFSLSCFYNNFTYCKDNELLRSNLLFLWSTCTGIWQRILFNPPCSSSWPQSYAWHQDHCSSTFQRECCDTVIKSMLSLLGIFYHAHSTFAPATKPAHV